MSSRRRLLAGSPVAGSSGAIVASALAAIVMAHPVPARAQSFLPASTLQAPAVDPAPHVPAVFVPPAVLVPPQVPVSAQVPAPLTPAAPPAAGQDRPVAWKSALTDSLNLLFIEHSFRIAFQEKTRRELGGPFFRDYIDSVHIPTDWEDGDSWFVNYVGHPIHGAAAGYLWRDASTRPGSVTFGLSKAYWASMGKSAAWIAGYSLQFEFGPLSEASIGNVGLTEDTRGWVDHAVTPAVGLGLMAAEDALDRYLVKWSEGRIENRVFRAIMRLLFNPARILSNTAQGHLPWYRPDRPLTGR